MERAIELGIMLTEPLCRETPDVSIVIPTLREDAIGDTLDSLGAAVARIDGRTFELLLVDDSPDAWKARTDSEIRRFNCRFGRQVTARRIDGPRRGKGAAMRTGIVASRGDFVFTMDADLPIPLENVARFLTLLADGGADVIVAERPASRNFRTPVRFVASRVLYALQIGLVFQSHAFEDTQCGFKAFRGPLIRRIASQSVVDGGMADIEYLYVSVRSRAHVVRVAVVPTPEVRPSKIDVRRALRQDPIDLIRIKLHGLAGGYDLTPDVRSREPKAPPPHARMHPPPPLHGRTH